MAISYKRLWKLLIDREMKKKDLMDSAGISWSTITKMGHDEHVSSDILVKICSALKCEFDDIMEIVPEKEARQLGAENMEERQFIAAMEHIVAALKERGYDPYAQLTGYVTENEPTYITSHKGARQLIVTFDMERVKRFVKEMK